MPTKQSPPAARSWGTRFDSLPPLSPPTSPSVRANPQSVRDARAVDDSSAFFDAPNKPKEEKMPHDASVFVGSLPTNIDQTELSRLLSAHLSEHAEVKNVKVVRDSKGGVCAFVQCEDAAAATSLIHTLHSTEPKPFLGRNLRYEPARAFRTLLVSYRAPTQFITNSSSENPGEIGRGKHVELDLPFAMRLWKPRNSRYLAILYNSEAVDAEAQASVISQFDSDADHVLHLQPVTCDEETARSVCAHFGQLESFKLWEAEETGVETTDNVKQLYPYPHNARRTSDMDTRCFEVKWAHRDDCVNALMTLRRVPHLSVTWAHQPNQFGGRHSPYHSGRGPNTTLYPMYTHDRDQDHSRTITMTGSFSSKSPPEDGSGNISAQVSGWKLHSPPHHPAKASSGSFEPSTKTDWSDMMDFPPLVDAKGERKSEFSGVWGEKKLMLGTQNEAGIDDLESTMGSMSFSDSKSVGNGRQFVVQSEKNSHENVQELDMPSTPGLGMSPITPRTPGVMFPPTPTEDDDFRGIIQFHNYNNKARDGYHQDEHIQVEKALDPTTLFVGGLEMYGPGAWDDQKVSNFFKKFGGLESVKVVRPVNGKAAFAFVKFDNTESPAQAVAQEHNRIYEGRAMRVQLRDCNPQRGNWKYTGRGRGRFPMQGGISQGGCAELELRHFQQIQETELQVVHQAESHNSRAVKSDKVLTPPVQPKSPSIEPQEALETSPPTTDQNETKASPQAQETYREWYDNVPSSATMTPPPVIFNSSFPPMSANAPNAQYIATGGYYPHPPWVHSYGPHVQYPLPFYPSYGGPPVASGFTTSQHPPSQGYTSNTGSDASGPTSAPPIPMVNTWPPMGMYGAYIPYPAFPSRPPPSSDAAAPQGSAQPQQQPPVVPTGFIQNDQGTLIAVYPPEALDQYMTAGGQPLPTPQPQNQNVQNWVQSQPVPPGTYMGGPPRLGGVMPMGARQMLIPPVNWNYSGHHPGSLPSTPSSASISIPSLASQSFRGGHGLSVNHLSPSFRRTGRPRDQMFHGKNNNNRSMAHRGGRGNMHGGGMNHQLDGQPRTMHFPGSPQFA